MEIEIISRETIKPSSPTPNHLKNFKLSLLDQLIPAPYAPLVLFYPNYDGASHLQILSRLLILKQSLSETLTRFYPLAGVIKNDLSIDCNDQGAYYATVNVKCDLSEFLNKPDLLLIPRFLPCETSFQGSIAGRSVTNIQVNVFECGGIALGLCISHKILDGAALITFLKAWAGTACGSETICPDFIAASLFPTNDLWLQDSSMAMWGSLFKKGKSITKRFVFNASVITTLRAMANQSATRCPTRVETVSAFIWKTAMAASEQRCVASGKPSLLTHVVNLRRRAAPNFSGHSLGNLIWITTAKSRTTESEVEFPALIYKVAESISKINGDYIKKLRGHEGHDLMRKSLKEIEAFVAKEGANYYGFTSWCKFGFYDIDFGWGKPVWVSSISSSGPVYMNLVILMETRCGDGIEAWVTLDEQEMELFEYNAELKALSEIDPSPLKFVNAAGC